MIFGTSEWTVSWLKHTHINTNKKQWVSNLQALHNDTALFHSGHKLFVLALFLWGVVMLCCFCTYLLHWIPLEHFNSAYHTPHLSHSSFCLLTQPPEHTLILPPTISEAATSWMYSLVFNLAASYSAGCTASRSCECRNLQKVLRGFLITTGAWEIWTNDNRLLFLPC